MHVHVCVQRAGRHPTAALPALLSGTLACQSKSVPSPSVPMGSPGSPRSSAFLSPAQPVLQPEEPIFYLSAFEMRTEDPPGPKAPWRAGAWGGPAEDGGGLCWGG